MNLRSVVQSNGLVFLLYAAFAVPLTILSLVSGLNASVAVGFFTLVFIGGILLTRALARGPIDWAQPVSRPRALTASLLSVVLVAGVIQLVPYGRDHDNGPVTAEPAWDSPRTRELAVKACFDCHSNEVDYPWYSNIAPVSWAVQIHVEGGRKAVNYSEWDRPQKEADESAETVEEGSMPPWYYSLTHPGVLDDQEKSDLRRGLEATLGSGDEGRDDEHEDDEEDDHDDD